MVAPLFEGDGSPTYNNSNDTNGSNDQSEWVVIACLVAVTLQMIRLSIDLIRVASNPILADKEMSHGSGGHGGGGNRGGGYGSVSTSPKRSTGDKKKNNEEEPLLSDSTATTPPSSNWQRKARIHGFLLAWIVIALVCCGVSLSGSSLLFPNYVLCVSAGLAVSEIIFLKRDPDLERYTATPRVFHMVGTFSLWLAFVLTYYFTAPSSQARHQASTRYLFAMATVQWLLSLLQVYFRAMPLPTEASTTPDSKAALSTQAFVGLLRPYFWPNATADTPAWVNRTRAVLTWVCVLGSKACNLAAPLLLGWASTALAHADYSGAIWNSVGYAALSWVGSTLKEGQSLVYLKVAQAAYVQLAVASFSHLHSLSLDWHLRKKMGMVLRSMSRGISACDTLMKYLFLWLVPAGLECIVVCFIFATYFSYLPLAVTVFYFVFLYTVWTILVTLWRKKFRKALVKSDNEMEDRFVDSMINFETVKYFTAEQYEKERFEQAVSAFQKGTVSVQASLSFLNVSQQVILKMCLALALGLSAKAIQERHGCCQDRGCPDMISDCCLNSGCPGMQVGDFVAVLTYTLNLFAPLNFLGSVYNAIVMAMVDLGSMSELLAESPDVQDAPNAIAVPRTVDDDEVPAVEFDNVVFHYPTQPSTSGLKGLSFKMKRGTTTAIVGPTGAGKTTVSRLLFRFYDVLGGAVRVNGMNVKDVTQSSLRGAVGVVPQAASLFNDTIRANLLYGRRDATDAELTQAAKDAQLLGFIESMTDQWETLVGDRGLKLSGGEKQRAAITRCLLKNPALVVLDEATSALDTVTENSVQEALDRLGHDRTVLVIAHRLGTIRNADQIIVLNEGVAAERGTHDELLQKKGIYARMWNMQLHNKGGKK